MILIFFVKEAFGWNSYFEILYQKVNDKKERMEIFYVVTYLEWNLKLLWYHIAKMREFGEYANGWSSISALNAVGETVLSQNYILKESSSSSFTQFTCILIPPELNVIIKSVNLNKKTK